MTEERDEFETALVRFAAAMDAIGVEYMVSGSMAMSFYARGRTTADIDVVVDPAPSDFKNMSKVLTEDFDADADVIVDELRRGGTFNVLTPDAGIKIDVITRKRAIEPDESWNRRQTFPVGDQDVQVISAEDLVLAKLYWAKDSHSEMQLRDVRNVLKEPSIDRVYIERRVGEMRLEEIWREATTDE
jgi:hypothetical protein